MTAPRAEQGATVAEFALLLPVLATLLFGIGEFGRALWTKALLDHAVNEAARCASVDATDCGTTLGVQTYAVAKAAPLPVTNAVFGYASAACGSQVTATYTFTFVAASYLPYSLTLHAQACFPK
ncbi:MAG TPA: TadE/TadG family type IV pilus assembly protein [Stellaceae bacterium]|nr:TadE/TadG family type IV pilus assembly protein [Stellaceae bacterium]